MYGKGEHGFDIVDNGSGYTQSDLMMIAKCLPERERNELYKKKSIGYRGEALSSLCKCATVSITTKHASEPSGLKVFFSESGDVKSLEPYELGSSATGTTIEVRDVFKNHAKYRYRYCKNIPVASSNALSMMTSFSLILYNTVLNVTNSKTSPPPAKSITDD